MDSINNIVINTMISIGYDEIEKKNISRNNILDIVSKITGLLRINIKKMCNYKKIIDEEFSKMENAKLIESDDEPINIFADKLKNLKLSSEKLIESDDEPLNIFVDKLKDLKLSSEKYDTFKNYKKIKHRK